MNVCYGTNDAYCEQTAVSVLSLLEQNRDMDKIDVYILSEGVGLENRVKLISLSRGFANAAIYVIECSEYLDQLERECRLKDWKGARNIYLYLFAGELFPNLDRILWLDGDTLITGPLKDLWETNMDGFILGAVIDLCSYGNIAPDILFYRSSFYFNTGVLLFNLNLFRQMKIREICKRILNDPPVPLRWPDQTMMNLAVPSVYVKHLDLKYNYAAGLSDSSYRAIAGRNSARHAPFTLEAYENSKKDKRILHFIGGRLPVKPWFQEYRKKDLQAFYLQYLERSPWKKDGPRHYKKQPKKPCAVVRAGSAIWDCPAIIRLNGLLECLFCHKSLDTGLEEEEEKGNSCRA